MTDHRSEQRDRAVAWLRTGWALVDHAVAYVLVNGALVAVWAFTGADAMFWPVFPIFGWGIVLVFHVADQFRPDDTDEQLRHEIDRMTHG